MTQPTPNPHKPYSVRQQPYRESTRFRQAGFDLISILLILVTVSSLTLAAVHVLCNWGGNVADAPDNQEALVPAIYLQQKEDESVSI